MSLADVAIRLIAKKGRDIVVVRSGVAPAVPAKPWRAPANPVTGGDAVRVPCKGVFVEYVLKPWDPSPAGEQARRPEKVLLIAAQAEGVSGQDLQTFTSVEDGGRTWQIIMSEAVEPGETNYLYQLGVVS